MPKNTVSHNAELEIVPYSTEKWEVWMKKLSALHDSVAKNVEEASNRQADYFNRNRREHTFKIGDRVWRKYHVLSSAAHGVSDGLAQKYAGNYCIAKVLSPMVYMLANASGKVVAKASVTDHQPYNRTSSQENAETRPAVADNAGARQRRRVDDELRESAESTSPSTDQLPATLAGAPSAGPAFDAPSVEDSDSDSPAFSVPRS